MTKPRHRILPRTCGAGHTRWRAEKPQKPVPKDTVEVNISAKSFVPVNSTAQSRVDSSWQLSVTHDQRSATDCDASAFKARERPDDEARR